MKTKLRIIETDYNRWIVQEHTPSGWIHLWRHSFMDKGMAEIFVHCLINKLDKFELI